MALDNLVSVSFDQSEIEQLEQAIASLESVLKPKGINLTKRQRQLYGRVRYEMEVWVDKVNNYMKSHSDLAPGYLDMEEFNRDFSTHKMLNPVIDRLQSVLQTMLDTNLLLGTDVYVNSLAYYRSVKNATRSNAQGAAAVYADLKQQFPANGIAKPGTDAKETGADDE